MSVYIYINTYNLSHQDAKKLLKEVKDYYLDYTKDKYGYKLRLDFQKGNTISIHGFTNIIREAVGRDVILYLVDNLLGFIVL